MSKLAKPIMVQGTMSNAGKSLIVTGLCRLFKQDGYRVAPFKSQNMALNSWITDEGLEMGRAQAVQAESSGIRPSALMNPVLLKPRSDMGSEIILLGKSRGFMSAKEYFAFREQLFPQIIEAYTELARQNDIIVIEGAGSPAEINLKSGDIVNMGLAKRLSAPVLLAGDIDRGGVFAQLFGTVALLDEDERRIIKGLIINKFRGNLDLLKPGLSMIEEKTGIPVAGVLRFIDIDIEDEDSLSPRLARRNASPGIDIAVIRLPGIANFTDFYPLEAEPSLSVRYARSPLELKKPAMIIIPGTRDARADFKWLRTSGLEGHIIRLAGEGVPVFGIAEGCQMLGTEIPAGKDGEEPGGESVRGMGLLPFKFDFPREKRDRRKSFYAELFGSERVLIEGYGIDAGSVSQAEGAVVNKGAVYGTGFHGFFDSEQCRAALIRFLRGRSGDVSGEALGEARGEIRSFDLTRYREEQFDKLAAAIREELDMKFIYRILEEGI